MHSFSLGNCDCLGLVLLLTQSSHGLRASAPVIVLVLSVFSSKGNALSTPSSVSLSAPSPLPYCSWPRGTVGFLNALSPFVSTHWLALCSSKSGAAWGAGSSSSCSSSSFYWCYPPLPPKNVKEKQTEKEKQEASVQPVRLCSSNENQSGLSESISEISVLLLAALQLSSQTIHNNTTDL